MDVRCAIRPRLLHAAGAAAAAAAPAAAGRLLLHDDDRGCNAMRTPPASPSRAPSAGDVVEHSGRQWHMDVAAMHATNFRVDRPDGGGVAGPDSGAGGYVVYDIEIVPGLAATASADSHTIERLHKRWSQVEALHTELVEELPNLPWREIVFPKKWVKTLDESDIEKRLRDMNAYYFALIQLFTKSRTPLRTTTAFGRFLAEPATFAGGDEARHTPQQLADIRAQSESDASDAAELKEAAKLAAERIVKADIRKAQQAGLDYDTFRKEYRPVGGDASLHKLWEEFSEGSSSATGKHRASGTGGNGGGGGSDGSSGGGWEALDLSRAPLSCDTMDPADTPKRAVVSCYVNDILKVDLVDEVFTPLLSFTLDWTDDGAIERSSSGTSTGWALKVEEDELWRPFMDFENLVEKAESLDDTVGVFTQGGRPIVSQFRRHINVLRPRKLDLREFPFDTMNLDVVLSFGWDSKELEVVPGVIEAADMVHSSSEYVLTGLDAHVTDRRYGYFERYDDSNGYPHMTVSMQLTRRPFYYIVRLVLTLCAVTCMEYASFLLDPTALSDRFGVSSSVVLAAIGIHYTAAENLPRISYLTRLDMYMFFCYVLIFSSFIENVLAFKAAQQLPAGPRDTTNKALMECYASWWRLACDADSLARIESTLASAYVWTLGLATCWFMWPIGRYYSKIKHAGQKHAGRGGSTGSSPQPQSGGKAKAE